MFGRLDLYVARTVLGSYLAGLLFMGILFTLIQLLMDLGGFLDAAEPRGAGIFQLLGEMAVYYLLSLPVVFVMAGPFVSVIAGMFAVARHMAANEVVPMLFTGRSMVRVLRPVLLMGCASALGMALAWEFVIPNVTEPLHRARQTLEGEGEAAALEGLVVKVRDGVDQTLFVDRYDHRRLRMEGITVVDRGRGIGDVALTSAGSGTWDPELGLWRLDGGERRTETRAGIRVESAPTLALPDLEPELLWRLGKEGRETVQLSYSELLDLRALRPGRNDLVLAFHNHITFPLANLILLLLALPFAVHFERGSRIERVVFAVLLCGAYLVADLTCQNLGNSLLHPVLAAWLPTIVFGSFGVVFFDSIRT
jgi:lipopolysaccharide export LptBFGC system permease protein LptF